MRLNAATWKYIEEYAERIDSIPEGAQKVAEYKPYGVGRVYYTIGVDLYIANYTGSQVPEWQVQYYALTDAEDASPSNEEIIAMLSAPKAQRPPVKMVECDCGHSVPEGTRMSASLGSSCPDCYDRMSD